MMRMSVMIQWWHRLPTRQACMMGVFVSIKIARMINKLLQNSKIKILNSETNSNFTLENRNCLEFVSLIFGFLLSFLYNLPMHLSDSDTQRLKDLVTVFLAENAKVNLSALRTEEQCFIGNVLDSLSFIDLLPSIVAADSPAKPLRILDIGTGGGFPLLPLAMLLPQHEFVGLDAVLKKVDAVDRIIKTLHIPNAKVVSARVEEFAHRDNMRGTFDIVTFRAVAPYLHLYSVRYTITENTWEMRTLEEHAHRR